MADAVTRLGILGSGQLGRMLALAAAPLGIRCAFYDEVAGSACEGIGETIVGSFHDRERLSTFASSVDAVTFEFENIPVETALTVEAIAPVFPPPKALEVSQDRVTEKRFFERLGIPTPTFRSADSESSLIDAIKTVGVPCVVKNCRMGYDGKGQAVVRDLAESKDLWARLGGVPLIVEQFLPFDRELSIIATRGRNGDIAIYPLSWNIHKGGILRRSETPAPDCSKDIISSAEALVTKVLEELSYVGTLAIELFELHGKLFANEMAPRVHNSGHGTIDGSVCSQFENHIRAVCGLPLGSTTARSRVVMLNLIGTIPSKTSLATMPEAKIHLYGKDPKPGRKIGHVSLLDPSHAEEQRATVAIES